MSMFCGQLLSLHSDMRLWLDLRRHDAVVLARRKRRNLRRSHGRQAARLAPPFYRTSMGYD